MGAITSSRHERAEVEAVFRSGLFDKAPRLGKFFSYICERYFAGNADQIKEYSIAVEALGRTVDFDSKRDSIVRVEAHRLRKRLDDYYKGAGADHPLQVVIPNGQYRPQFLLRNTELTTIPEIRLPTTRIEGSTVESAPVVSRPVGISQLSVGIGALLLALLGLWWFSWRDPIGRPNPAEVWSGVAADPVPAEFRMLTGYHGPSFIDHQGHTWVADAYYAGGLSIPITQDHSIEGLPDPNLIKAQRSGSFRYDIPVAEGTHEVRLYFAETDYGRGNPKGGGDGSRTFDLAVNGQTIERVMDPLAGAGAPNRLYERILKDVKPAADGKIHLAFQEQTSPATLNAIEILSSTPGRIQPIRILTQAEPVTDSDGRVWAADEYYNGGSSVFRRNVLPDKPEHALFQGERYGNFSYRIPLAPGKYRLTLHFVETWFGTANSQFQSVDSRIFDVYANGIALLRNFEVGKEAGGPNRLVEKTFEKLQPSAQGILLIEFVPVKNYAEVNAIEVVGTE